jgi:predicted  nucleic acid-binding Zn-ribbon protein
MAAARVEADLAAEKLRMEGAGRLAALQAEADSLAASVRQLKDELAARGEELEFLKEELQAKKEELEEVLPV